MPDQITPQQEMEQRLMDLQEQYPQWWLYSDTLGERPIDGMVRNITRYQQEQAMNNDIVDSANQREARNTGHNIDVMRGQTWDYLSDTVKNKTIGSGRTM